MKNQNKINKIVIGVLIVLTLVLGYRALTEQKRVDYIQKNVVFKKGTKTIQLKVILRKAIYLGIKD